MHCQFLAVGYWKSSTASGQLSLVPYPRVYSSISRSGLSISRPSILHRLMWTPIPWLGQHRYGRDIMLTSKLAIILPMSSSTEGVSGYRDHLLVYKTLAYRLPRPESPETTLIQMQRLTWWFARQAPIILKQLRNLSGRKAHKVPPTMVQPPPKPLSMTQVAREVRRFQRSRKAPVLSSNWPRTNSSVWGRIP